MTAPTQEAVTGVKQDDTGDGEAQSLSPSLGTTPGAVRTPCESSSPLADPLLHSGIAVIDLRSPAVWQFGFCCQLRCLSCLLVTEALYVWLCWTEERARMVLYAIDF